jgi:hypothetical protein
MVKPQQLTISVLGCFLVCGLPAAFFCWIWLFLFPDAVKFLNVAEWPPAQIHVFAIIAGIAAGGAGAAALVFLRRVLPEKLQFRVVWLPSEMFDSTRLKKQTIEAAVAAVMIVGLGIYVGVGPPRFWGDFTGMSEDEVRERLGEPFRDSRHMGNDGPDEFTLGWYQGLEQGFFLTFKGGNVVAQNRYSR